MLHKKFGFDWPSGFREEDVSILWSQAAQCILVQNIYFGLKKIGNLCQKYRRKFRKIGNFRPKTDFFNNMENHNYEQIAARKQRPRAFKACFWPQILLKNKFWTLGAKTIPKTAICLVF